MNKDIKKLWVNALLSGEYKQGKGILKDLNNKFCCLGVLCEIHSKQHPEIKFIKNVNSSDPFWLYLKHTDGLPSEVITWAKFTLRDSKIGINNIKDTLIEHNDCHNHSFEEIGNAINEQL